MARYDGGGVDAAINDLSKVLERMRVRLDALDQSHFELKEAIRDGRKAFREVTLEAGELRREVTEFRQDVAEFKQDVRELKHDVSALKQDVAAVNQKVETLDVKVHTFDQKVEALDSKVEALDNRVHTLEDKSKASDHRFLVVEEKVDVFSRDLQVVRAGFEQAVESLAKLSDHVGASTSELRRGLFHVNGKVARLTVDREDTERRLQAHESILNKLLKN
ncbi:hypothetical protein FJV41_45065 [Myxococcus llanfairpwllgwyngyllgogerychwyrndrobwllllantysiliogogogochensis]|uniref:Uncharacterized protein n=1 Tax=Myxococcus llanfairpwllgwyngyllgogerychwyrndrobwllllantysiliogogogochensis TaxID=2590453 RepID=A0A540WJZ6_9BACT|nr:hypothetical protein [Myxococcus llanfairpwllgwyngyllgogerychwyrndrobwllllantysiliogogogochensis]TQF09342.1 hypothetical protein FJV41_45065 [Myxococcus llanfairpwllgwyngyllgogerychwyrndrobwllllantysiliogogogochensis]